MNKRFVLGIIIVLALALGIYGYMVLPETVVVQIDLHGNPSNTYPKNSEIAFQLLLSIGGAIGWYLSDNKGRKYLVLAMVGLLVSVLTLIYNV